MIEKDWASFCTQTSEHRQVIDDCVSQWVDFENSYQSLNMLLKEFSDILDQDANDKIDHGSVEHSITRYEVYFLSCHF